MAAPCHLVHEVAKVHPVEEYQYTAAMAACVWCAKVTMQRMYGLICIPLIERCRHASSSMAVNCNQVCHGPRMQFGMITVSGICQQARDSLI